MDDVDFTVLAATSVLGDLIDNCPPAEACRDAFDRMSKATVQMCLSTTGFGSRAAAQGARRRHEDTHNSNMSTTVANTQPSDLYHHKTSRPPPQFDMNLRDLFTDELQDGRSFGSNLGRWQAAMQVDPATVQPPQQFQVPAEVATSEQHYSFNPMQPTASSTFHGTEANHEAYDAYDLPGSGGLDFLLADNDGAAYLDQPGLDLGFDSRHDWADGAQLDLFDGFFFGGMGNVGNGG